MTDLLGMVNNVRGFLRDERITAIASTDIETTELVAFVNRASRTVFDSHAWSFLPRRDSQILFYAKKTGTAATTALYSTTVTVEGDRDDETDLSLSNLVSRLQITDDTNFANIAFKCSAANYAGSARLTLTLADEWLGDAQSAAGAWELFAAEAILPSAVSQVLSVYDEDQPLQLEFIDRDLTFDRIIPRPQDAFGQPEVAYVGGVQTSTQADRVLFEEGSTADGTISSGGTTTLTDTSASRDWVLNEWVGKTAQILSGDAAGESAVISSNTAPTLSLATAVTATSSDDVYQIIQVGTAATGISMMLWPIPDTKRMIRYSHTTRPTALSAATDTFDGVPDRVNDLIEIRAYAYALVAMQNDPATQRTVMSDYRTELARAIDKDDPQPKGRKVARDVTRGARRFHPNTRWASQQTS